MWACGREGVKEEGLWCGVVGARGCWRCIEDGGQGGGHEEEKDQTMPIIDGVGDELLYTALVAAPVVVVICRSSLG